MDENVSVTAEETLQQDRQDLQTQVSDGQKKKHLNKTKKQLINLRQQKQHTNHHNQ